MKEIFFLHIRICKFLLKKMKSLWFSIRSHCSLLSGLLIVWGLYFFYLFYNILKVKPDGIYFGHVNVWSDWALHISIANIFAFKSPSLWFAYHPIFADGKFTYPFFIDMISGFLMRLGLSLENSFIWPSFVFLLFLVIGLYFLAYIVTSNKVISFLSVNFFFLSAGFGFVGFFRDLINNPTWSNFLYPIKDYSALFKYDWYAGNVVVGLLLPQRAFLLGITLGVWSLIGLLFILWNKRYLIGEKTLWLQKIILIIGGIFAGILTIVHPHSLIALVIIAGIVCLVNYRKWRLLIWYVLPAGLLAVFLFFIFIYGGIDNSNFFSFFPGWGRKNFGDWLFMWLVCWGFVIPIAITGFLLIRKKIDLTTKYFFGSFFLLFIFANLFLFQPIRWDNSKLFWWVYFGFSILTAIVIYKLWSIRKFWTRIISIILVVIICLTGFIELLRLVQTEKHSYMGTNMDDIELGLTLRNKTDPLAKFLTQPSHNHFVMVWAIRPIFMGYTAWVYNYGFGSREYEKDLKVMYAGGEEAKILLRKHEISYVVIGSAENRDLKANESYYRLNFPVAFENKDNRVYDTRSLFLSDKY